MGKPKSKPDPVPKLVAYGAPEAIKIATSNLFIDKDNQDIEYMTGLIFEDIGGMELSNLVRYDEINTTENAYNLVSNTAKIAEQITLDFNLPPSNNNSIDLNDYVNKEFVSNVNVLFVQQYAIAPGGTAGYRKYYVDKDLSEYDVASGIKVTVSGIGTVGGYNFDATNSKVLETGNGYFILSGGSVGVSKTSVSGKAQFSDYIPVYYESDLYEKGVLNEDYSNITIEVYNNYTEYEVEVEFLEYDDKESAET
jgi:hypothetical protein